MYIIVDKSFLHHLLLPDPDLDFSRIRIIYIKKIRMRPADPDFTRSRLAQHSMEDGAEEWGGGPKGFMDGGNEGCRGNR